MGVFPSRSRPKESYKEPPRAFGSPRDHGGRKHAGCDLYAPAGTEVLAVEDGTVLRGALGARGGAPGLCLQTCAIRAASRT
jgi:murein DD-endopeptidase MepM/ murein hydrolase activator NlpD